MSDVTSGSRGQVSLSVVEAVVGLFVVLAASTTFLVGLPDGGVDEAELSVLAGDGLTALDATPPRGDGASRLTALAQDRSGFVRERNGADAQLRALYPTHVRYRLETPYGTVGDPRPPARPVGMAREYASGDEVTLWVWVR